MSIEAAKELAEGIAWAGFWIGLAIVLAAAMHNGWRPWE